MPRFWALKCQDSERENTKIPGSTITTFREPKYTQTRHQFIARTDTKPHDQTNTNHTNDTSSETVPKPHDDTKMNGPRDNYEYRISASASIPKQSQRVPLEWWTQTTTQHKLDITLTYISDFVPATSQPRRAAGNDFSHKNKIHTHTHAY